MLAIGCTKNTASACNALWFIVNLLMIRSNHFRLTRQKEARGRTAAIVTRGAANRGDP